MVSINGKNVIGIRRVAIERILKQYKVDQEIEIVVCRLKEPSFILNLSKLINSTQTSTVKQENLTDTTAKYRSLNEQIFNELITFQDPSYNLNLKQKPQIMSKQSKKLYQESSSRVVSHGHESVHERYSVIEESRRDHTESFVVSEAPAFSSRKSSLNENVLINVPIQLEPVELAENLISIDLSKTAQHNDERTVKFRQPGGQNTSRRHSNHVNTAQFSQVSDSGYTEVSDQKSNKTASYCSNISITVYDNTAHIVNRGSSGSVNSKRQPINKMAPTVKTSSSSDVVMVSVTSQPQPFVHPQIQASSRNHSQSSMSHLIPASMAASSSKSASVNDFTGSILAADRVNYYNKQHAAAAAAAAAKLSANESMYSHLVRKEVSSNELNRFIRSGSANSGDLFAAKPQRVSISSQGSMVSGGVASSPTKKNIDQSMHVQFERQQQQHYVNSLRCVNTPYDSLMKKRASSEQLSNDKLISIKLDRDEAHSTSANQNENAFTKSVLISHNYDNRNDNNTNNNNNNNGGKAFREEEKMNDKTEGIEGNNAFNNINNNNNKSKMMNASVAGSLSCSSTLTSSLLLGKRAAPPPGGPHQSNDLNSSGEMAESLVVSSSSSILSAKTNKPTKSGRKKNSSGSSSSSSSDSISSLTSNASGAKPLMSSMNDEREDQIAKRLVELEDINKQNIEQLAKLEQDYAQSAAQAFEIPISIQLIEAAKSQVADLAAPVISTSSIDEGKELQQSLESSFNSTNSSSSLVASDESFKQATNKNKKSFDLQSSIDIEIYNTTQSIEFFSNYERQRPRINQRKQKPFKIECNDQLVTLMNNLATGVDEKEHIKTSKSLEESEMTTATVSTQQIEARTSLFEGLSRDSSPVKQLAQKASDISDIDASSPDATLATSQLKATGSLSSLCGSLDIAVNREKHVRRRKLHQRPSLKMKRSQTTDSVNSKEPERTESLEREELKQLRSQKEFRRDRRLRHTIPISGCNRSSSFNDPEQAKSKEALITQDTNENQIPIESEIPIATVQSKENILMSSSSTSSSDDEKKVCYLKPKPPSIVRRERDKKLTSSDKPVEQDTDNETRCRKVIEWTTLNDSDLTELNTSRPDDEEDPELALKKSNSAEEIRETFSDIEVTNLTKNFDEVASSVIADVVEALEGGETTRPLSCCTCPPEINVVPPFEKSSGSKSDTEGLVLDGRLSSGSRLLNRSLRKKHDSTDTIDSASSYECRFERISLTAKQQNLRQKLEAKNSQWNALNKSGIEDAPQQEPVELISPLKDEIECVENEQIVLIEDSTSFVDSPRDEKVEQTPDLPTSEADTSVSFAGQLEASPAQPVITSIFDDGYGSTVSIKNATNESFSSLDDATSEISSVMSSCSTAATSSFAETIKNKSRFSMDEKIAHSLEEETKTIIEKITNELEFLQPEIDIDGLKKHENIIPEESQAESVEAELLEPILEESNAEKVEEMVPVADSIEIVVENKIKQDELIIKQIFETEEIHVQVEKNDLVGSDQIEQVVETVAAAELEEIKKTNVQVVEQVEISTQVLSGHDKQEGDSIEPVVVTFEEDLPSKNEPEIFQEEEKHVEEPQQIIEEITQQIVASELDLLEKIEIQVEQPQTVESEESYPEEVVLSEENQPQPSNERFEIPKEVEEPLEVQNIEKLTQLVEPDVSKVEEKVLPEEESDKNIDIAKEVEELPTVVSEKNMPEEVVVPEKQLPEEKSEVVMPEVSAVQSIEEALLVMETEIKAAISSSNKTVDENVNDKIEEVHTVEIVEETTKINSVESVIEAAEEPAIEVVSAEYAKETDEKQVVDSVQIIEEASNVLERQVDIESMSENKQELVENTESLSDELATQIATIVDVSSTIITENNQIIKQELVTVESIEPEQVPVAESTVESTIEPVSIPVSTNKLVDTQLGELIIEKQTCFTKETIEIKSVDQTVVEELEKTTQTIRIESPAAQPIETRENSNKQG